MYLKAISTAFSALSALASVGRALGASAATAAESANGAQTRKTAPLAVGNAPRGGVGWARAATDRRKAGIQTAQNRFMDRQ